MNVNQQLYADSVLKLLNPNFRELTPEIGARGSTPFEVRSIDEVNRTVTAYVSTPNVDRYEEIVLPEAFTKHLPTFMANPVLCAGHSYIGPAGEPTVIGHWLSIQITPEGVIGTCQFMEGDELAERWWQRFRQKSVRAFSVGWITHAWEMRDFKLPGGEKRKLRVFTEVELIEISAVAIPANRQSLVRAATAANAGAVADVGGVPSRRSIERIIREQIRRELLPDPDGALSILITDVCRVTLQLAGIKPRDIDPWASLYEYDDAGHHCGGHDLDEDETDDLDEDSRQLLDDVRDALDSPGDDLEDEPEE